MSKPSILTKKSRKKLNAMVHIFWGVISFFAGVSTVSIASSFIVAVYRIVLFCFKELKDSSIMPATDESENCQPKGDSIQQRLTNSLPWSYLSKTVMDISTVPKGLCDRPIALSPDT